MQILSIFRLGPRSIAVIVPETGETNLISGFFLLKKIGVPASTCAPSLQISLGMVPKKSSGFRAKVVAEVVFSSLFSALPLMFRFAPLWGRILFITSIKNLILKSFKFTNYTALEKTNNKGNSLFILILNSCLSFLYLKI